VNRALLPVYYADDDGSNGYVDSGNVLIWGGSKNYLVRGLWEVVVLCCVSLAQLPDQRVYLYDVSAILAVSIHAALRVQGFNKAQISNFYVYPDYSPITLQTSRCGASDRCKYDRTRVGNGYGTCAVSSAGTAAFPVPLRDTWFNNTCIQAKSADLFAFGACQPAEPNNGHIPILANNTYATGDAAYLLRCGNESWDLASAQAAGIELGSQLVPMPSTQRIVTIARQLLGF
jgi:hypothetical protein